VNDSRWQVITDTDNTITNEEGSNTSASIVLVNLYSWPLVWVLELSSLYVPLNRVWKFYTDTGKKSESWHRFSTALAFKPTSFRKRSNIW